MTDAQSSPDRRANALRRSRAPAQAGNLFVTYNRSSFTFDEFISAWIATIPSRVHHAVQAVVGTGEGVYDVRNGPERLGDFNAIGRDPLMAVVLFAINKYATPSNAFPAERPHGSGGLTRARRGRALS